MKETDKIQNASGYARLLAFGSSLITLAINPILSYDPINLIKMLCLSTLSVALIPFAFQNRNVLKKLPKWILICVILFVTSLIISFLHSPAEFASKFWGVWGRSTGLLTYLCYITLFLISYILSTEVNSSNIILKTFSRTSYFITLYTLLQFLKSDPINWSQKQMVATLGNVNFMSGFLGLAGIYFICQLLVVKKIPLLSKMHYLFFLQLNIFLIWQSGSIQGLGVILVGLTSVLLRKIYLARSLTTFFVSFLATLTFGVVGFLGIAGMGPFGGVLSQETVRFRIDYWQAGAEMTLRNPFFGIGIDQYGDYYREYRDLNSTFNNGLDEFKGVSRVSNTAHNVFLDVSSGSGVLPGLLLFLLVIGIFIKVFTGKSLTSNSNLTIKDSYHEITCHLSVGWIFFMLISIGQIGIMIWGFIFLGITCGALSKTWTKVKLSQWEIKKSESHNLLWTRARKKFKSNDSQNSSRFTAPHILRIFIFMLLGMILSIFPNIADMRFLAAARNNDKVLMHSLAISFAGNDFYRGKLLERYIETGDYDEALSFARFMLKVNPRNSQALLAVVLAPSSTREEKIQAVLVLRQLDPYNGYQQKLLDAYLFGR